MRKLVLSAVAAVVYISGSANLCAETALISVKTLPLSLAVEAAQAALLGCAAQGFKVSVSVVDRNGLVKVLLVGDGARQFTVDFSRRKAYTASIMSASTSSVEKRLQTMPDGGKGLLSADANLVGVAGGLPLLANDEAVAAIGVSGAPGGDKDEACAQMGVDKIKGLLK